MKIKFSYLRLALPFVAAFGLSGQALAAPVTPVTITVSGVINSATGTLASELGNTVTATYLIDLDRGRATYVDFDSSNNPGENFTTYQEFFGGTSGWSASSSSGGSVGSQYVGYQTINDFTHPVINAGQPFDALTIVGADADAINSSVCPQSVLDVKGYCDKTDLLPGKGFELGLDLAGTIDWFNGTNTPNYIPGLSSLLYTGVWGTDRLGGLVVGEFGATVSSMTVTSVPVPGAVWLLGSGLLGLIGVARRKAA